MKRKLHSCQEEGVAWLKVCGAPTFDGGKLNYCQVSFLHEIEAVVQPPFFEVFKTQPDEVLSSLIWTHGKLNLASED